jgi:hypothetical protein
MTDRKTQRVEIEFKLVRVNPARIPPQQEAARRLIAQMREPFPILTYLNELIRRAQPSERQDAGGTPDGPLPVEPALAEVEA